MVILGAAFMTSSPHLTAAEGAAGSANGLKEASLFGERDPLAHSLQVNEAFNRRNNLLNRRLQLVEELWESVILQECGQSLVDLLQRLRSMCSPEGQALEYPIPEVLQIIEYLSLDATIQTARAFALFFQLINIVEQHYERAEDSDMRMVDSQQRTVRENEKFERLFPYLRAQGVPPGLLRRLLEQLHIRMVFTAHPTEIVRHTIREKQRAFSRLLGNWIGQNKPSLCRPR
jgi:phosphoenolpyruvate carboxylase